MAKIKYERVEEIDIKCDAAPNDGLLITGFGPEKCSFFIYGNDDKNTIAGEVVVTVEEARQLIDALKSRVDNSGSY